MSKLKKPSRSMVEHLRFVKTVTAGGGKCGGGRCLHHQNQMTREALERRGLLQADKDGYLWVTPAGEQVLAQNPKADS